MMPSFVPVELHRKRFYQRESSSKDFSDLTDEDLSFLAKKVYKMQESFNESLPRGGISNQKLERYLKTMQYLTNPPVFLELKSFDERMAFLIMMTDPNLVTFKEFLKLDLISTDTISKEKYLDKKLELKTLRNRELSKYESTVREKIGFFDLKLLNFEEMFFNRFFNKKELLTEVNLNNQDSFIRFSRLLSDFNSVSDERYEELVDISKSWLALVPDKYNSKVATYSVTKQKELLGLTSLEEQFVMFILMVDPNLDMLKIYEEESFMPRVEGRIKEEFGYFNPELLSLEKTFHNRFCPNKKISVWSKTKKD